MPQTGYVLINTCLYGYLFASRLPCTATDANTGAGRYSERGSVNTVEPPVF